MTAGDGDERVRHQVFLGDDRLPAARSCAGATSAAGSEPAAEAIAYDGVFRRLAERTRGLAAQVAEEHVRARRDLAVLLALPPEQRTVRVRDAATRFSGPVLAELLLAECGRDLAGAPLRAHDLARLAEDVLMGCAASTYAAELLVRAVASRAHALAAVEDFSGARHQFALLHALLKVLRFDELVPVDDEGPVEPWDDERDPCDEVAELLLRSAISAGFCGGAPFHPHRLL